MPSDTKSRASKGPRTWLDDYPAGVTSGDLFADAPAPISDKWRAVASGLASIAEGDAGTLHDLAARHIADLGMTFRVAGDDQERSWPLTPMPLIIGAAEWGQIERGLIQRATLFERLAEDIYGPQRVIAEGHLPAAVIAGSPYFARKMLGRGPTSGHFIHVYAADLARGPQGQWRVLQDRVRLATGIGYALENRLAMSRTTDPLLSESHVRRVADFYATIREGIATDCRRELPRIALLTPGRFNQTYAEQAHMARYLGLPLVEGRDLSVMDNKLFIGTIGGPKRVDALWRWVNTSALDPLTFDAKSQLGVANMFEAWASGGLEIANWPGVEVLETPAFSAFIPRLCRVLMGEAPILPTVATWWCGQKTESEIVKRRIGQLALLPAFGEAVEGLSGRGPVNGAEMGEAERAALFDAMRRRPMDYCAQEIVHLSTTPALIDGEIAARPFTIRAFVARTPDGEWSVMPGGFARLASSDELPTSLMGAGDLSADVWVVDDRPTSFQSPGLMMHEPPITRGGGILASQAADNLYWFGRYNERAEVTVRIVRSILDSSIEVDGIRVQDGEVRRRLVGLLVHWGAIHEAMVDDPLTTICARALAENTLPGGVATLLRMRHEIGLGLRERFARDFWRIASRPMPTIEMQRPQSLVSVSRVLMENFNALSGLASENMVRGSAWRFLQMGRRIERAVATCSIARHLAEPQDTSDSLGALLDLCDSQIIYRSRYLTGPMRNPVYDLVLLDPENPRSLAFQVAEIAAHLGQLPALRDDHLPEQPLRLARALVGRLETLTAQDIVPGDLGDIEAELLALSDALSLRYFLQFERKQQDARPSLLE